jgi:hypothetical protein
MEYIMKKKKVLILIVVFFVLMAFKVWAKTNDYDMRNHSGFNEDFEDNKFSKGFNIDYGEWNDLNNGIVTLSNDSKATINKNYTNFEFEIQAKFLYRKSRIDLNLGFWPNVVKLRNELSKNVII